MDFVMFCEKIALFVKKVFLIFHFKSKYFKEQTTILPKLQANHSIKFTLWNKIPPHIWALKALIDRNISEIYNVGYGKGFSVKEVIDCVKKVSGKNFLAESAPRREGDPSVLVSDNQKILTHTQWKPKYDDLEIICKSAYLWEENLQKQGF